MPGVLGMTEAEVRGQHHHEGLDERSSAAGLRAVAGFEALKGIGVILLGVILVAVHQHAEDFAESLMFHLHMDPDKRFTQAVLNAAWHVSDARLWTIVLAVMAYAAVRFVEAWGLWNRRVWAEWFALLSGTMYLPWEILKLIDHVNWEHIAVLVINLTIIGYMLMIRFRPNLMQEVEESIGSTL